MKNMINKIIGFIKKFDPETYIKKLFKKLDKNDYFIFILTFVLGIINNFYFIIGKGVAPDAISSAYFSMAGNWEITLGRFLLKYVDTFRYGVVCKLIIILICLACIGLSIMIMKRIFNIKSRLLLFILTCLITFAPQFTETYMFIYCADSYLIAFFLSTLSVYFLDKTKNSKLYYLFAIICISIICALYQAYLGVVLGLIIILLFKYILDDENFKSNILRFILFFVSVLLGMILYYIILNIVLKCNNLVLASYKGANSLGIDTFLKLPNNINQTYKDFISFFFENGIIRNSWFKRQKLFKILFSATFISILTLIIKRIRIKNDNKFNYNIILVIVLLLIFPIGISIMNLVASGTRINLVTGPGLITFFVFVILIYNYLPSKSVINVIKWIMIYVLINLSWTYLLGNSFTYIAREQTVINYQTIAMDIYTKATQLEDYDATKKWMFNDIIRFRVRDFERSNGFITGDNLTWNNYSGIEQNAGAFEKFIGIKIKFVSKGEYKKILETDEYKEMPIYPLNGSIKVINDIIVVKLSEKSF